MPPTRDLPNAARLIRLTHLALFGGVGLLAVILTYLRMRPMPDAVQQSSSVGVAMTIAGVLALAVASALVRPRIPSRAPGQGADAYWNDVRVRTTAMILWAMVEGAGLLGALGYYLSGLLAPAGVLLLAMVAGVLFRPSALEAS